MPHIQKNIDNYVQMIYIRLHNFDILFNNMNFIFEHTQLLVKIFFSTHSVFIEFF